MKRPQHLRKGIRWIRFPSRETRRSRRRRGMTLYEVLVALAIFSGAMAALGQSISTGRRASVQAKLQSEAVLRCESKLSEILAGVEDTENAEDVLYRDDETERWSWSLVVEQGPHDSLLNLIVTARHAGSDSGGNVSYSISRLVRDPELFRAAAEAAANAIEE